MLHPSCLFPIEPIRQDFPILHQEIHGSPLVYFDNGASTQQPKQVIEAVVEYVSSSHANVHRGVHSLSQQATERFEQSRTTCQAFLAAKSREEIVFTHGTTEAINMIAFGWAMPRLTPKDDILVTALEHHANFVPWQQVALRTGATLRVLPFNQETGRLAWEQLDDFLTPRTAVVAVAHASNVLGSLLPLSMVIEKAHDCGAVVVVDGAQSVPHMPIDVQELGCDFFVCSGHKMYAPTGIGLLYGRKEHLEVMEPLVFGGAMIEEVSLEKTSFQPPPQRFEAGTPPIAAAIGLEAAVHYLESIGRKAIADYESLLTCYAWERLSSLSGVQVLGAQEPRVAVFSFLVEGVHPYDLGQFLDAEGIAIRTGHHCAQPLMDCFGISGTARISFGLYNTFDEIDAFLDALSFAIATLSC